MAKRRTPAGEIPDALREAVERTVEATREGAQGTRERAQNVLDEVVETVGRSRSAVLGALDERRPATQEDVKELRAELRKIGRRLDAIEGRLPKKRSSAKTKG